MTTLLEAAKKLSKSERILLVQEVWNSIEDDGTSNLSDDQRRELETAITDYERNPHAGRSWEEVKADLMSRP